MKVTLYDVKCPKCLKCKIPMSKEGYCVYTDEQEKMINCKHDWIQIDDPDKTKKYSTIDFKCKNCQDTLAKMVKKVYDEKGNEKNVEYETLEYKHIPTAEIYRCPKCLDLYKVEGD